MCALTRSHAYPAETYSYSAYGLAIRSEVPLPAAVRHDRPADLEVRRASLSEITNGLASSGAHTRVTPRETHLLLPRIGTFLIRDGREILVDSDPETGDDLLQLAIVGPALAALLQQQGCLILHASAVVMDGVAVSFLGARGAGKSTMAAALHARGHPLLADDMLAVRPGDGAARAVPGFPQLKLWPDALLALGDDPETFPRVRAPFSKRALRISGNFCARVGLRLACLYVLCGGDTLRIEQLAPRAAFLQIVCNSYAIEWLHGVSGQAQFKERAQLVQRTPVRRLERPPDLRLVPQLVRLVEDNLESA